MPDQIELLAHAAAVNKNIDPEGPHVDPTSDAYANMHREYAGTPAKAATKAFGDDQSDAKDAATTNADDYAVDDGNENNARVAERLRADKEAVIAKLRQDKPVSFHRAGSALNPGDLSAGGMGGDLGEAAGQSRGDTVEAAQQTAAWGAQATAAAAMGTTPSDRKAAAGKAPVGAAAVAGSNLLGDDSPAVPVSGPAPATAGDAPAAWPTPEQQAKQ